MAQIWSPEDYVRHAAFVPALGASILEHLAPRANERILDLGCGEGVLTAEILARGAPVEDIVLIPRPTLLPTGMAGWLQTFAGSLFAEVPADRRAEVEYQIVELLRPSLSNAAEQWTADYVRLQVFASRP
jgi:hypothetical protein